MFPNCSDNICLNGIASTTLCRPALVCFSPCSLSRAPLPLSLPLCVSLHTGEPSLTKGARHYGVEEPEETY